MVDLYKEIHTLLQYGHAFWSEEMLSNQGSDEELVTVVDEETVSEVQTLISRLFRWAGKPI